MKVSASWFLLAYAFLLLFPVLILYYHADKSLSSHDGKQESYQRSEVRKSKIFEEKDPFCSVQPKSAFLTSSQEILFKSLQRKLSEKDCRLIDSIDFYLKAVNLTEVNLTLATYFHRPRINFVKRNKDLIAYVALLALQEYELMSDIFIGLTGENNSPDLSVYLSQWLVDYQAQTPFIEEMKNFITLKAESLPEAQRTKHFFALRGTELIRVPPSLDYYFEDYLKELTFDDDNDFEDFLIYTAKEVLENKDYMMEIFAHFTKKDCDLTKNDCIFEWIAEKQSQEKNTLLIQGEPKIVSI